MNEPVLLLMVICPAIVQTLILLEKATAFVGVNLAPMTVERVILEQTVLVKGALITAIGSSKEIDTPDNSIVIDGSNFYLIPGIPQVGTYTVNVTVGTKKGSATDIQAVLGTIPLPEVAYFSPRDGAVLNSTNPTFSLLAQHVGLVHKYWNRHSCRMKWLRCLLATLQH
jgi:hypothetical protein